jgi:hypothetical protein
VGRVHVGVLRVALVPRRPRSGRATGAA